MISPSSLEKLDFKSIIAKSKDDWQDNTEHIRKLKHSDSIAKDVLTWMQILKTTSDPLEQENQAKQQCSFLASYYPDIFQKLVKHELHIGVFAKIVQHLAMIEKGEVNQMEGSIKVGELLKTLYIDSAIRHGETLDKQYSGNGNGNGDGTESTTTTTRTCQSISWKDYKLGGTNGSP